MSNLELDNQL